MNDKQHSRIDRIKYRVSWWLFWRHFEDQEHVKLAWKDD